MLLLGFTVAATPARATYIMMEGDPQFGLTVMSRRGNQPADTLRLGMMAWSHHAAPATGMIHLVLPAGLQLVGGDTARVMRIPIGGPAPRYSEWEVTLLPRGFGHFDLHGIMEVDAGPDLGVDRLEMVLPIEVRADRIIYGDPFSTRAERRRGTERYRLSRGQAFPVPLDPGEDAGLVVHKSLDHGVRTTHTEPAVCPTCPGKLPMKVQLIAFIGRDGGLREIRDLNWGARPTDPRVPPPEVVSAAKEALKKWRFTPSYTTSGEPMSDFLETWVEVRSE